MRSKRILLCFLVVSLPSALLADVRPGDLPAGAKWYFHVDFDEMRGTDAGKHLYRFLQGEVFDEVHAEVGVDLDKEADRITAFAARDDSLIIVVDGSISQQTEDMIMAMGAATGAMDKLNAGGQSYYYIRNDDHERADNAGNVSEPAAHSRAGDFELNGLDRGAYFSFALKNKVIVTSSAADMQSMLQNNGKVPSTDVGKGALLVLSADKSLIQAGLHTNEFADEAGWDSNIIKNTEQLALLVADEAGKLAITAQLVAAQQEMVESLASIVRGLIALQAFNDEMDPEISQFLQSTNVEVKGSTLTLKIALDPEMVIAAIE